MYEIKLKLLPVVMVAASAAVAAGTPAGTPGITPGARGAIHRVDVGRQEVDVRGGRLVREGNALFAAGKFKEACAKYREAKVVYSPFASYGSFAAKTEYCDKRIADCYYQMAMMAIRRADELAQSREYD